MGSTQADVEVSYDVSNEFFRLWLDERMNYTSGIFDEGDWHTSSLEEAQVRKLACSTSAAAGAPTSSTRRSTAA
jgi:cyclopropane-fatty-acyl-phospholipid synthase